MSEGEVLSVIPIEETIIDPLYEPLKLNRYKLCEHLQRLKDISHLRYGFSPYLLFDVEGMKEVVETIGYLFSIDNPRLKEELDENTAVFLTMLKNEFKSNGFSLSNEAKKEEGGITDEERFYIIKEEDEKLNVYRFKRKDKEETNGFFKHHDTFLIELKKYLTLLEGYIAWENDSEVADKTRNEYYKELKDKRDDIIGDKIKRIKGIFSEIKEEYKKILKKFLYSSNEFEKNFAKISHLFHLEYPIRVKCPLCEEAKANSDVKPYMFMCEEGKIYSVKEALLRTFELRRSRWLYLSGVLHTIHRASTHTRLSHQIGSMIVAVNALYEMDVYTHKDMSMRLGEYLLMRGELYEFLMANFLHDIGHPPLSHVLEPNPFIELDHEKITRNLIYGKKTEKEEGMDWYVTEHYLLKMKAIKDFEHRFIENKDDPIYHINYKEGTGEEFLKHLEDNNEILESEIVTVSKVLDNFDINKKRVVEILTGKIFCPKCDTLSKIEGDKVKCEACKKKVKIEKEKIYDIQFLNTLIDSEIDFDRMDHVKRDSVVCGLSLISFRLLELLGGMSVVLPESDVHEEIHNRVNKPYIFISEDGLLYVTDLLTARGSVFRDILYSDENNWINGVVNQITALAVRYLPHLTNMLPSITDPILAQFYMNDLFLGTQIEKLNKLFHGKMDCSAYGKPMRYKLKDGVIVTKEDLRGMYKAIEKINAEHAEQELPAVVFYTNIKPTKCPNCGKKTLSGEPDKMLLLCPSCKKELNENDGELICENENCDKSTMKSEEAIKALKCNNKECNAFSIIIDPSEDLENMFTECPFYKKDHNKEFCVGRMEKQEKNLIKCKECGKKICKLIDERWDDMLVYEKKFAREGKQKYLKFNVLAGKYKNASRERFLERPSELDVKNLFYVWVSDFVVSDRNNNENSGNKSKNDWIDDIIKEIGKLWAGKDESEEEKIDEFEERFVDLDEWR